MRVVLSKLPQISDLNILETGGPSPIAVFLCRYGKCFLTETDLRIEIDCGSNSMDCVLSLEVFEHIKDAPEKSFDEVVLFQESGVRNYAAEMLLVLKPGGILFLSTPNGASARVFIQLLAGKPPSLFGRMSESIPTRKS